MTLDDRTAEPDDAALAPAALAPAAPDDPAGPKDPAGRTARTPGPKKRRKRQPVKRATIVLHRWTSLVLGLLLLVITTTGALVVYTPEWTVWTNSGTFQVHESDTPVSFSAAMNTVEQAHPGFGAGSVNVYHGLYEVYSSDEEAHPGFYGVDPGTGEITGQVFPERGVMAFLNQVHECFFTCEGQTGYVSWLNEPVPTLGMGWLMDVTYGGLILGLMGLFLLFLCLSGIWLWYPGIKRWSHGFRVRMSKGRYARDRDLHQVIGMAAIPFLLVWGLTGASFEFEWVSSAWYGVTGGQNIPDPEPLASNLVKDTKTPDIGMDAALAAAQQKAGGLDVDYASAPVPGDETSAYNFWFDKGFDQYEHGAYPGNLLVAVDRHDASRTQSDDYGSAPTLSNQLMDNWAGALFHYGQAFNGWWRLFWFGFGLTPLLLAVTGISTWLFRRSTRRRRSDPTAPDDTPAPVALA